MRDPRDDPFWKDNLEYCDECGGNPAYRCHRPGSPRCPKFQSGVHDEFDNHPIHSERGDKLDGLQHSYQFSVSGSGVEVIDNNSISPTTTSVNASVNGNTTTWTGVGSRPDFKQSVPGAAFQYTETYMGPGLQQSYDHPKRDNHRKHNRNYKRLYAVIVALFCATPAHAETVGGVSATAAPVANSSASVTNQFIQVLQGPYITSSYGDGIQCQGSTLNITPYVTTSGNFQRPYEDYWDSPVYDMRDMDEDGAPDNPGPYYTTFRQELDKKKYTILV